MTSFPLKASSFFRSSISFNYLTKEDAMKGLGDLMKQAQEMQANMQKMQEDLAKAEVTGSAGAGLVSVVMTGRHDVKRVNIDPSLMTEDKEMLEDYSNRSSSDSDVDMVGHKIAQAYGEANQVTNIDFLSYRKNLVNEKTYGTAISANTLANTLVTSSLTNVEVVSLYTKTDKGMLNNRIKIEKPLNSESAALIEYNSILQSSKLGEAIVNGYETTGTTANVTYFSIVDHFEKDETNAQGDDRTYLCLTARNKNKNNEETNLTYTFDNTDISANNITVTSYSKGGPQIGAHVYFKPKPTAPSTPQAGKPRS